MVLASVYLICLDWNHESQCFLVQQFFMALAKKTRMRQMIWCSLIHCALLVPVFN